MAFNDLPAPIQSAIQQGYLARRFQMALRAKLGFRAIADREPFAAGIGESITKTRRGLLPAITTLMAPAQVQDFTSGLTPQNYSVEQYTLAIAQYPGVLMLNVATARVAIDDLFLENVDALGEQAIRSVDTLAQRALYDMYMGGNTRVTTTLGSAATTVKVDDVRGFFMTMNSQNVPVSVSNTAILTVVVGSNTYTLTACQADGSAPATLNPWMSNLSFSGSGANTSTAPGGYSGTLTFSTNVSVADGTAGNQVQSAVAPVVVRPNNATSGVTSNTTAAISAANDTNNGRVTMQMILQAKATMSTNAVPKAGATGNYIYYADPLQLTGLYQYPAFQRFFIGKPDTAEYRKGIVAELLECNIVETDMAPVQTLSGAVIHRGILCEEVIRVEIPPGSIFKGHEPFLVQDLVISAKATCYLRERWVTPDGRTILAPLPQGIAGHFGPELRRFVLVQYHQGQSTMPRLLALLRSVGVSISKRQLVRLLNENHEGFIAEARDVLRAQ
jgi:hypothetical protein